MVEIVLCYAMPRQDMQPVSRLLVDRFGSVGGVFRASRDELLSVQGVTSGMAEWINLTGALVTVYRQMHNASDIRLHCCKQVAASMKERKTGKIINVSSPDYMGVAGKASYVTAKAAVHGFTGTVCREMERYGVTANVLTPDHNATPAEIAGIVAYLCSEDTTACYYYFLCIHNIYLL
jgi:hypothetical protein